MLEDEAWQGEGGYVGRHDGRYGAISLEELMFWVLESTHVNIYRISGNQARWWLSVVYCDVSLPRRSTRAEGKDSGGS